MPLEMIGRRFGRWLVVDAAGKNKAGRDVWACVCDCGTSKPSVIGLNLRSGGSVSCGCHQRERAVEVKTKHGHLRGGQESPTHVSWRAMLDRCRSLSRQDASSYTGRGITVADRWLDYRIFLADMGERPSRQYEIDRIDNDKGYHPGNCRWATDGENSRNRRTNRTVQTPLGEMLLCEAVDACGLSHGTLYGRLKRGWPASRLFDPARSIQRTAVNSVGA